MFVLLAVALAVTLGAIGVARGVVVLISAALVGPRSRRRVAARESEAGWIAASAQRWLLLPALLGGPTASVDAFREATFDALGIVAERSGTRRSATGVYRLFHVRPGAWLDACAAQTNTEATPAGGLLVVGTGEFPDEAVSVLVLGPLVQICLPDVPWALIRRLLSPVAAPVVVLPEPTPAPGAAPAPRRSTGGAHTRPQRERRMPSWRSPKPTTRRRAQDRMPDRVAA